MTISSSAAFPARSPMPLIVPSTWVAPARTAASVLATAMPRSLWQCTDRPTLSIPGTRSLRRAMRSRYSWGVVYPTVSGTLMTVAPARMAASITRTRKSGSVRVASSAENSTSSQSVFACRTAWSAISRTSSRDFFSLWTMWISDVAMNV